MKIIPAIDIRQGKCVRLFQGDFEKSTEYGLSPLAMANFYKEQGATEIHIVDLDGAKNPTFPQNPIIAEIASQDLVIQMGGGVRSEADIIRLLTLGVSRVVIGSMAVKDPQRVIAWLNHFGSEKIVLALDVNIDRSQQPRLVISGWQEQTSRTIGELLDIYQGAVKYVLCTDISRDGTLTAPNFSLYETCIKQFPTLCWQASGGVSTLHDITTLNALSLYGTIVGKAFYENKFTIKEAMQAVEIC